MATTLNVFRSIQKIPQPIPVVQFASETDPILGKGLFQPPKKSTTPIIPTKNIIEYSAKNIKANLKPEYST